LKYNSLKIKFPIRSNNYALIPSMEKRIARPVAHSISRVVKDKLLIALLQRNLMVPLSLHHALRDKPGLENRIVIV